MYKTSSQYTNWTFTKEKLSEIRKKINDECRIELKKYYNYEEMQFCITPEEEVKIVNLFLNMIRHFFRKFTPTLPAEIYGISATYYRRFFLKHSVMKFHPREIIVACIYSACKTDEFSISLDKFLRNIPNNSEKYHSYIHKSELFIINELNFDLLVYTPYNNFKKYLIEFREFQIREQLNTDSLNSSNINEVINNDDKKLFEDYLKNGIELIHDWYETDLMIIFTPNDIALSVVFTLLDSKFADSFWNFIRNKVCDSNLDLFKSKREQLEVIQDFVQKEYKKPSMEDLTVYENKIDSIRHPLYNPQSEVYLRQKEEYDEQRSNFD